MTVAPLRDTNQPMPAPQGCAIGFVNNQTDCDEIISALNIAGFTETVITVLFGEDGIKLFKRMMGGSSWGEAAEDMLTLGVAEMSHGHLTIIVHTHDRNEAVVAASVAARHGGHGFSHFGLLVDERLTP